jgi:2Fe-2S ferredoxin
MPKLIVTDREGATHTLDGPAGWSVMEVIRENNLPVEAACGGCCACATCHVYVDEAFEVRDNSRLSCQIKFGPALDGLAVTLAPEF